MQRTMPNGVVFMVVLSVMMVKCAMNQIGKTPYPFLQPINCNKCIYAISCGTLVGGTMTVKVMALCKTGNLSRVFLLWIICLLEQGKRRLHLWHGPAGMSISYSLSFWVCGVYFTRVNDIRAGSGLLQCFFSFRA